jgi:tol-pal system protein YbgF
MFIASPVLAVSKADLEARIQQLERKLNRIILDQNDQASKSQRKIQELRGEMEVLSHEMQTMQKKQRDLYLDIDRRLNENQTGSGAGLAPGGGMTGQMSSPGNSDVDETAARAAYDQALGTLKQGRYDQALGEFKQFLQQHPGSGYVDNAQYWVGEVHYVTRKFPDALREFETVIARFPDSPKVADARLKIGFINYEMKQWGAARTALEQVTTDYPGSTSAKLASGRLDRMSKEGH